MPRVWFMDSSDADQRLPHRLPGTPDVAIEELREIGVNYWKVEARGSFTSDLMHSSDYKCLSLCLLQLDPATCESDGSLAKIKDENGYNYTDVITVCPEKLPNYEDKVQAAACYDY